MLTKSGCKATIDYPLGAGSQGVAITCEYITAHPGRKHRFQIYWEDANAD